MGEKFGTDTLRALGNTLLGCTMDRATRRQDDARKAILPELGDPWAMKERAGRCRDAALDRADERLAELAENVRRLGGQVHFALDGSAACQIVHQIAARNRCKLIVKTKSMITEEIHLNSYLGDRGIEVVETDLGEYIIQLADEPPSHILGPACHKTAAQVAELFKDKLGVPYTEDPQALAGAARGILRDKFRQADMGITGCNFAVAETGQIVVVTNEGNGRFVTSRPRVLVTVVGMEKVIGGLDDLAVLLKVLGRCATGQRSSVYTNLTAGPRRPGDADGPEEFHLIVVDNGRSSILAGRYRQLLRCIRCGACLNACPVYRKIGGHAYSSVYVGPIGQLLTPLLESAAAREDFPQACTLCESCRDACPVRIELPEMFILMRDESVRRCRVSLAQRLGFRLWAWVMRHPVLYRLSSRMARVGLAIEAHGGWVERIPPAGDPWTDVRDLKLPATRPFHQIWRQSLRGGAPPVAGTGGPPALPVGCGSTASSEVEERRPHREPVSDDSTGVGSASETGHSSESAECPPETFLGRVRHALRAVQRDRLPAAPEESRRVSSNEDLLALFTQKSQELHVGVHDAADAARAVAVVAAIVSEAHGVRAVMADEGVLSIPALTASLSTVGCSLTVLSEGTGLAPSFGADVGITLAELAIAETGAVVLESGGPRRRLTGLAPPIHIAVLPKDRIVADLLDWAAWSRRRPVQASQTMIAGPSKTADIELNLVTGMHAPGVVHVILMG